MTFIFLFLIRLGTAYLIEAIAATIAAEDFKGEEVGRLSKLKYRFNSYLYVKFLKKELMSKFTSYVDENIMLQKGFTEIAIANYLERKSLKS